MGEHKNDIEEGQCDKNEKKQIKKQTAKKKNPPSGTGREKCN